jgi:membrane associated rhomboid family serine protease
MIPLYDETPRHSFPFVNYLLIALNVFVFFIQLGAADPEGFIYQYGFVPAYFDPLSLASYQSIITSMFMHGGILHIVSNMLFLHIFGDNVEDRFGHVKYLLFYLGAGLAAALSQYFLSTASDIPMIGASGAVSGIAGAYFLMFSHSKVRTLVPFFGFMTMVDLSAGFVLGYWFVTQIFSGIAAISTIDIQHGGVAWFAHIGGFVFGYLATKLFASRYNTHSVEK